MGGKYTIILFKNAKKTTHFYTFEEFIQFFCCFTQVFISTVVEKYAQMLEWYTSTLEVRMPQGVGVRVSFWVLNRTFLQKYEKSGFLFLPNLLTGERYRRTPNLFAWFDNAQYLYHKLNLLVRPYIASLVSYNNRHKSTLTKVLRISPM